MRHRSPWSTAVALLLAALIALAPAARARGDTLDAVAAREARVRRHERGRNLAYGATAVGAVSLVFLGLWLLPSQTHPHDDYGLSMQMSGLVLFPATAVTGSVLFGISLALGY